ncbi:hypothetical protein BpHYR1_002843, partial [Brachionus plicatilis]
IGEGELEEPDESVLRVELFLSGSVFEIDVNNSVEVVFILVVAAKKVELLLGDIDDLVVVKDELITVEVVTEVLRVAVESLEKLELVVLVLLEEILRRDALEIVENVEERESLVVVVVEIEVEVVVCDAVIVAVVVVVVEDSVVEDDFGVDVVEDDVVVVVCDAVIVVEDSVVEDDFGVDVVEDDVVVVVCDAVIVVEESVVEDDFGVDVVEDDVVVVVCDAVIVVEDSVVEDDFAVDDVEDDVEAVVSDAVIVVVIVEDVVVDEDADELKISIWSKPKYPVSPALFKRTKSTTNF